MIIDSHSHWLPDEIINNAHFFHKGWGDIEGQVKIMSESGVDKAVLTYPTSDAHLKLGSYSETSRIFNENIAKIMKRYPDKFIGAAALPIDKPDSMLDELNRALDAGFKALTLASSYDGRYPDHKDFLPIYRAAGERGVPIFVHAQIVSPIGFERVNDPLLTPVVEYVFDITMCIGRLLMSDILRDYKVKFVFANFGGALPLLANRFDATYQMLRGLNFVKDLKYQPTELLKNIYVDTGGDRIRSNFMLALELLGPKHILWGSDWPAKKDLLGSMSAVKELGLSEEEKMGMLGGNLEYILKGA